LPGKSEAWRRSLQELRGSRQEMFTKWCAQNQVHNLKISLWENRRMAWMIVSFHEWRLGEPIEQHGESPFYSWLRDQLLELHGVDLDAIHVRRPPDVLLEI
jgi:hypothetical protein